MAAPPQSLFRRRAGDDWVWSFSTTDDVSGWSDPVITIRAAERPESALLASSQGEAGIPAVSTTGTDFSAKSFRWKVAKADTQTIPPTRGAVLQVEVLVDGEATTVMTEYLEILGDYAVRA